MSRPGNSESDNSLRVFFLNKVIMYVPFANRDIDIDILSMIIEETGFPKHN